MSWIGVITGDIVNSSEILKAGQRDKLLDVMHQTIAELNAKEVWGKIQIEIFRGDSFQIITDLHPVAALTAIIFRAKLITNSKDNIRWDARLGIGIGNGEYLADKISESDGEAFHLSGEAFDKLDKNSRLQILTPDEDFNSELNVSTAFADDIISNWTIAQANIYYQTVIRINTNQKEIAEALKITPQAVSKLSLASKAIQITNYIVRFANKSIQITNNK